MAVVERVEKLRRTIGGESHAGWLPAGAAVPLPTPVREVELDLAIEDDGGGFLLLLQSRDGSVRGDTWHGTIGEAREAARESFGVPLDAWRAASGAEGCTS